MESRSDRSDSVRVEAVVDPRTSLALWLRAGRAHRGMSLDDVAKVTKIQPRILERLEAGKLDGLPAEVFVRGFVRSFARCVGLDEREALRRYAACGGISAVGSADLTPTARALVEAMAELAPGSATAARATPRRMLAVEVDDRTEADRADLERADIAAAGVAPGVAPGVAIDGLDPVVAVGGTEPAPVAATELVESAAPAPREPALAAPIAPVVDAVPWSVDALAAPACGSSGQAIFAAMTAASASSDAGVAQAMGGVAQAVPVVAAVAVQERIERDRAKKKKRRAKRSKRSSAEPVSRDRLAIGTPASASPVVTAAMSSAPWRRPVLAAATGSSPAIVPSLVIDDADPESAERLLEARASKDAPRRSFLPPILLDREDRWARQGGLALAVILLLIAATLTLSYLMRRPSGDPSASGHGTTRSPSAIDAALG